MKKKNFREKQTKNLNSTVTNMLHMSQKDYTLEIVRQLQNRNLHIRGLAVLLKTNQTTIARKIKELGTFNVVDYKLEGKNKVYMLKKTVEAREYVYLAEHYTLLQLLHKYPILRPIIQKIKENTKVHLAILFGSYVKGLAYKESDIDLYIETTDLQLKKSIESFNTKLSVKIGKYDSRSFLIQEIEKNHVIIKGVERYYEHKTFFS